MLKIISYANRGDIANEKVIIEVIKNCNLNQFEIFDQTGKIRRMQDLVVSDRDYVWYYTTWHGDKEIISTQFPKYGFTVHEVWWGLKDKTLWNIENNTATIK